MQGLKLLIPYLKKYKLRLILGLIFVTISNICSTYSPRIVGNAIDLIKKGSFTPQDITYSIIYLLLLTLGSGITMFLMRQTIIVASRLIEYDLRNDFLFAIESQPMGYFHKNSTGSLMAHATNDIQAAREFLGPAIMYFANAVTTFSFALYFMLRLNPIITAIALIPLPIISVAVYFMGRKVYSAFKDVQENFATITTQAQETFSGVRIIRSFVREKFEQKLFTKMSDDYMLKNMRLARIQAIMMPTLMILVGMSQLLVLGYGGWQVIHHQATLGDLTQFFIYINLLIWPVAAIGWVTNLVQRANASCTRLQKIIDSKPEINKDVKLNNDINSIDGIIEFQNVSLNYNNSPSPALNNVSFKIEKGKSLGITGTVGSGKSSIIHLIPKLFNVSSGNILIDGHNISEIPYNLIRQYTGIVQQDIFLFSTTITDNIRFGMPEASMEKVISASKLAQLDSDVNSFPENYETMLGERGVTLSGGQKQRLAIARAALKEPSIFILDDALSAVDTQTEEKIINNISQFMQDRTTIIISHRISTIKNCSQIIVMDNGEIVESGTHDELVTLGGRYADIYSRQQLEEEISNL